MPNLHDLLFGETPAPRVLTHDIAHNRYRYIYYGCRCKDCRADNTEYAVRARKIRTKRLAANPLLQRHGRRETYINWGCRCEACKIAQRVSNKATYLRRRKK